MKRSGAIIDFQTKKREPMKEAPERERALNAADFFIWAKLIHNDLQNDISSIKKQLLQWDYPCFLEKNGNQERILSSLAAIESHVDIMKEHLFFESLRLEKEVAHIREKYNTRQEVVGK